VAFSMTVSAGVTPTISLPDWLSYDGTVLLWEMSRDLAPADCETFQLVIYVWPTVIGSGVQALTPPAPGYTRLFDGTTGSFVSEYPPDDPRVVSDVPLAGPLDIGAHHETYSLFLPLIMQNYGGWWPQSIP